MTNALEKSIQHWEDNVAAKTPNEASTGWINCALCKEFLHQANCCLGCPVRQKTGLSGCKGSPYHEFNLEEAFAIWMSFPNDTGLRTIWRKRARAELKFLKSLRVPVPDSTFGDRNS